MHLTRGARFQAARRHNLQAVASAWAVTVLSMYVFSASAYMAIYDLADKPNVEKPLILLTIIMSAFIIAFSVLEQGKKHDLKSELFLRCAQKVQELWDRFELDSHEKCLTFSNARIYVKDYNDIVHDFSDNHSESDFRTFRILIGKHNDDRLFRYIWKFRYWFDCWAILLVAIVAPPFALSLVLIVPLLGP